MSSAPSARPAPVPAVADGAGPELSSLTTLHVGGPARRFARVTTADELVEVVRTADAAGEPVLLVGGGSNLLVGDGGFDGLVVQIATRGVERRSVDYCGGADLWVSAGEPWDDVVAVCVAEGFAGIEALSGIPGSTGATPVQNVGAYGQDVAGSVAAVRTWDRAEKAIRTVAATECGFGYRDSRFKRERFRGGPRYVVLQVGFQLAVADLSGPLRYVELARTLGVDVGARVPLAPVRDAVLDLRARKGMLIGDPRRPGDSGALPDHDTWSAGSFFTNPVLDDADAGSLPADAPRWPQDGGVKTSAAWLIERAGFHRGFGLPGPASLSTKHTLALTNRGSASAADLLALAREVRDGVQSRFGVRLVPEPELVNCSL